MNMEAKDQYPTEVAKLYNQQEEENGAYQKVFRPNALDALQLVHAPTMKIIDLGCGNGEFSQILQKVTGGSVIGFDLSSAMIQIAKEEEAKAPQGIKYFVYDLAQYPMKDPEIAALAPYDYAYCGWTYSYAADFPTLEAMIKGTSELLKKGGVLVGVIESPFLPLSKYQLLERYGTFMQFEGPGNDITDGRMFHMKIISNPKSPPFEITAYLWTAATFEKLLKAAGFTEFAWLHPPLRINAENEYEAQFYDVYAKNPDCTFFRARK